MTVHFIGAGPGAPDLLDAARAAADREQPGLPLRGRARAARDPRPRAARRARRRHPEPHARRDRRPSCGPRTTPATTSRGCTPATSRSTARSPSRRAASTSSGSRGTSRPACRPSPPPPPRCERELTIPGVAQTVILTRYGRRASAMPAGEDLAGLAAHGATLVVHLGTQAIEEIVATLAPHYGERLPRGGRRARELARRGRADRHARDDRRRGPRRRRQAHGDDPRRPRARPRRPGRQPPLLPRRDARPRA